MRSGKIVGKIKCVWAVERLHQFLYSSDFDLVTDHRHRSLQFIFGNPRAKMPVRVERWGLLLTRINIVSCISQARITLLTIYHVTLQQRCQQHTTTWTVDWNTTFSAAKFVVTLYHTAVQCKSQRSTQWFITRAEKHDYKAFWQCHKSVDGNRHA